MATIVAIRHNPAIKAFYAHLKLKGKASKVAIVACMRKFITILNQLVKTVAWVNVLIAFSRSVSRSACARRPITSLRCDSVAGSANSLLNGEQLGSLEAGVTKAIWQFALQAMVDILLKFNS
jgi:transposase